MMKKVVAGICGIVMAGIVAMPACQAADEELSVASEVQQVTEVQNKDATGGVVKFEQGQAQNNAINSVAQQQVSQIANVAKSVSVQQREAVKQKQPASVTASSVSLVEAWAKREPTMLTMKSSGKDYEAAKFLAERKAVAKAIFLFTEADVAQDYDVSVYQLADNYGKYILLFEETNRQEVGLDVLVLSRVVLKKDILLADMEQYKIYGEGNHEKS